MMSIPTILFFQLPIETIEDNRFKGLNPFHLIVVHSAVVTTGYGQFICLNFQLSFILLPGCELRCKRREQMIGIRRVIATKMIWFQVPDAFNELKEIMQLFRATR